MWLLHVTSPHDPCAWLFCSSAYLRNCVDWAAFYGFAKNVTSLECQRSVVSAHDASGDFFRSHWALLPVQPSLLVGWLFYTTATTFFSSSHQLGYNFSTMSTSSFWRRSPTHLNKPLQIEQKCRNTHLIDYLQINAFPDLVVEQQE